MTETLSGQLAVIEDEDGPQSETWDLFDLEWNLVTTVAQLRPMMSEAQMVEMLDYPSAASMPGW